MSSPRKKSATRRSTKANSRTKTKIIPVDNLFMSKVNFEKLHNDLGKKFNHHYIQYVSTAICVCDENGKRFVPLFFEYEDPIAYKKGKPKIMTFKSTKDEDAEIVINAIKKSMVRKDENCKERYHK